MKEKLIQKVEKEDIKVPELLPGESAIVLQRHEKYEMRDEAESKGSLIQEDAEAASKRYKEYFKSLFSKDTTSDTMILFVSSDTNYKEGGYRSMETAQLALWAAVSVLEELGINPSERIINLHLDFNTKPFDSMNLDVRPDRHLIGPKFIEESPEYVQYMKDKYGDLDGYGYDLSTKAWGVHEDDGEAEKRKELGAEGVYEVLERVKRSISIYARYARMFHSKHSDKKLLIWATSHYDTISPLVKDTTDTDFSEFLDVEYGGGVVIRLGNKEQEAYLEAQGQSVPIKLKKDKANN